MTKTAKLSDLCKEPAPLQKRKPIEFTHMFNEDIKKVTPTTRPSDWDYVVLVITFADGMSVMKAWDDNGIGRDGQLFYGYWNDGVVE
jgi:preprotein translocase subunit SecE